jgi:hypothetical protein
MSGGCCLHPIQLRSRLVTVSLHGLDSSRQFIEMQLNAITIVIGFGGDARFHIRQLAIESVILRSEVEDGGLPLLNRRFL